MYGMPYMFQQVLHLTHNAVVSQNRKAANMHDNITTNPWPGNSSDIKRLDYSI